MEFQEKYQVDIALFDTTGATTERVSPYYDMLDCRRIDFITEGRLPCVAGNTTKVNTFTLRLLSATDSTGGGSTGISSATAVMGKGSVGCAISSTDKVSELFLTFSTYVKFAGAATVSVLGQKFTGATGATAGNTAYAFAAGSSDQATVASEGFVACFNSTNNTLTPRWEAATMANSSAIRIYRTGGANDTYITATGSTLIMVGVGKSIMHLGIDAQHLKDGQRYVAIGVRSSDVAGPFVVTALRQKQSPPAANKSISVSKSMNGSTSK